MSKYIGDKSFYLKSARIAIPLSIQQMLGSMQAIIDTIMVTWINKVTAVGTAAQLDTLCNMVAYGMIGGVNMFAAQFYGANDEKNLKKSFGLSLIISLANAFVWFLLASVWGEQILRFYLNDNAIIPDALAYLKIMKYSLVIGAVNFCFSYMYRSCQKAKLALYTSLLTTLMNIVFNAIFIFGLKMSVTGAALGTLLAQSITAIYLVIYAYYSKQPFVGSLEEMFNVKLTFVKPIVNKIIPLIINETLFGFGTTLFIKAFGELGTQSMDAYYVSNQIFNVFLFVVYGYGAAVQVLLGERLGRKEIDIAKKECNYHLGLSFILSLILVVLIIVLAKPMVAIFALQDHVVNSLAISLVYVLAIKISIRLFNFIIFSILRSGGDTKVIQFLDSGLLYLVGLPLAFICVYVFDIRNITLVLLVTQIEQLVRLVLGMKRVNTNIWAKDITKMVK